MLFAILTRINMVGTSVKTPTVVASTAGEFIPNKVIATATASSKKFDAPVIAAGAEILNGNLRNLHPKYAIKKIKKV